MRMRRLRAGAYVEGDYLIRYLGWLGEAWDGARTEYRPWHVFRRASAVSNRTLLDRFKELSDAQGFVAGQIAADRGKRR